jgi:hypothetical protein
MRGCLSHIRMTLRLSMRDRTVVFFNYLLPLMFFFLFGQMMRAEEGRAPWIRPRLRFFTSRSA